MSQCFHSLMHLRTVNQVDHVIRPSKRDTVMRKEPSTRFQSIFIGLSTVSASRKIYTLRHVPESQSQLKSFVLKQTTQIHSDIPISHIVHYTHIFATCLKRRRCMKKSAVSVEKRQFLLL